MDILENKVQQVEDDRIFDKDIKQWIKERWPNINLTKKEFDFVANLLKGYSGWQAYQLATGTTTQIASAKNQATRWARKLNLSFEELLEFAGHGVDQISETLDQLKTKDPDAYLRHIIKLKKLDVQKIELSGKVDVPIPIINIITEKKPDAS